MKIFLTSFLMGSQFVLATIQFLNVPDLPPGYDSPGLPVGKPLAPPSYMVDNTGNTHHAAPDKGSLYGPILTQQDLAAFQGNQSSNPIPLEYMNPNTKRAGGFWMDGISHGSMPLAPTGYEFYRNVYDFGAMGDGLTDDTIAINQAIASFSKADRTTLRCGQTCGSTTTLGALVYFPKGTYIVSAPIVQYYYTQFVGDPNNKPVIKGRKDFKGIALIDTDIYIPSLSGLEWYINQNQFFRQIRNFVIDLTSMPLTNITDGGQTYAATGIHWQVAQATSLQNIDFLMSQAPNNTQVGIFMENGSGGFVSDLTFLGGNIGFRSGSQQYTGRNLYFKSCQTAISMGWDWGFTWKNLTVEACHVGIDSTFKGGISDQGTGSMVVLDSTFIGVPFVITLSNNEVNQTSLVLDNLVVVNSAIVVSYLGGDTIFAGSSGTIYFTSWAMGRRYTTLEGNGTIVTGLFSPAPNKPPNLLDSMGRFFCRSRPQYEQLGSSNFVIATSNNILNDGTGDQTTAINTLLAKSVGTPVFFPAGIYQVQGTVFVPVGSIIVGEGWSQIRAYGPYFQDSNNTQVMVKVGNPGDKGIIEISDMLFTVRGPTAGAILMQWNVHESFQGSAGMWDSHFRVGGAAGSDLQIADCPKGTNLINSKCIAASLLLYVTALGSGYFENVWAWVADHDIEVAVDGGKHTDTTLSMINIYGARGMLIESEGPSWFYGTASEHSVFYQYELHNAKDIFLGHMQTETPYMQPSPGALQPFKPSLVSDPTFPDCDEDSDAGCEMAWALRILSCTDIFIYGAGLYSFFSGYDQKCLTAENCQNGLIETSFTEGLWIYDLFTIGAVQAVSPRGGIDPVLQSDTQSGFSTEISAYLALALQGGDLGGDGGPDDGSHIVYIDPIIWMEPTPTWGGFGPVTFVVPPSTLPSPLTIVIPEQTVPITRAGITTTVIVVKTTITTSVISFSPVIVGSGTTSSTFAVTPSFRPPPISLPGPNNLPLIVPAPRIPYPFIPYPGLTNITMGTASSSSSTAAGGLWMFPTLPTTVITSGTVTQTFSEDQITSLRSLRRTVQYTTTWVNTKGTRTTNTPVPIWIQTGGFYWSPIPIPGINPFPQLPPLSLPPLPNPPCFKLLGIFSIDCPPDKGNPSTHYTSNKPSPTCTARNNCGTIDRSDENESTSTCATETRQTCGANGQCHTYVGCGCPTTTATDYYVSCSSTTCTTTSSQIVTGCYVTASATTTAAGIYCPLDASVGPNEEQADAGPATMTVPSGSTPGYAVENTQTVTASAGSVVIGGGTYSLPKFAPTTITVAGGTITVYPAYGVGPVATTPAPTLTSNGAPYSGSGCASYTTELLCHSAGSTACDWQTPCLSSTCASHTTEVLCYSSGSSTACDWQTPCLSSTCASYTTEILCISAPGSTACDWQTLCVPTAKHWPTWNTQGSASCPESETCVKTTIDTKCAESATGQVTPRATAMPPMASIAKPKANIPHSDDEKTIIENSTLPVQPKWRAYKKQAAMPNVRINIPQNYANSSIINLFKRQDDNGCQYRIACATGFCATASRVPCIQASIEANTGGASGTAVTAIVKEDGVVVCQASVSCSTFDDILGDQVGCSGTGLNPYNCGSGNSMIWQFNNIQYTSKKYGLSYPLYLPHTVTNQKYVCLENVGLRALPAICIEDSFALQQGPCAAYPQ